MDEKRGSRSCEGGATEVQHVDDVHAREDESMLLPSLTVTDTDTDTDTDTVTDTVTRSPGSSSLEGQVMLYAVL